MPPIITLHDYQAHAWDFAKASGDELRDLAHWFAGLGEEVGEVQGKFKRYLRKDFDIFALTEAIKPELGDTLWYISAVATALGIPLAEIATGNILKLEDRRSRGVIRGTGDRR